VKGLVLTLGQRQVEVQSEKSVVFWRETVILSNFTCCGLRPGVLFQVPFFPTSHEVLYKSQTLGAEVRNLPLAVSSMSKCQCLPLVRSDTGAPHGSVRPGAYYGESTMLVQFRLCWDCCYKESKLKKSVKVLCTQSSFSFFFFVFVSRVYFSLFAFLHT